MDHQILIDAEVSAPQGLEDGLRRVITAALAAEGVALPCEISVLLTDDGTAFVLYNGNARVFTARSAQSKEVTADASAAGN